MLSPGREHDLKIYERLVREATTIKEREKWKHKIRQILNESNHPDIMQGRANLIEATRNGDLEKVEQITDELHKLSLNKGLSR